MFTNALNVGKEIANKLSNKFLNLSESEARVKEATNGDKWGPNGSIMKEIAEDTFSTTEFHDIMTFLWYRIFSERPINNRRIYKGLVLLAYLIVNGSDYVIISCKSHLKDIAKLKSFNDQYGVADISIRKKATDICELLNDFQRLSEERQRAKTFKSRCYRSETVTGVSSFDSKNANSQGLGDIDDWHPDSKSIPYVIGESFLNFVSNFTHNISGPPPTETHDNFEIPSMDDEIASTFKIKKDEPKNDQKVKTIQSKEEPPLKVEKNVKEIHEVVPEVPIIDFSEPVFDSPITNISMTNRDLLLTVDSTPVTDMSVSDSNIVHQRNVDIFDSELDVEFGNLRSWNDFNSGAIDSGNSRFQTAINNDFKPDFKLFEQTSQPFSTSKAATVTESPSKSQTNATTVNQKVGATWNDLDSLNIDLNNLCSRKHLYSKS